MLRSRSKSSASLFEQIIFVTTNDPNLNMIILTGHRNPSTPKLHDEVAMALQAMDEPQELKELWLPQFKCNHAAHISAL